ncbi:MAG: epoxyqueuosine reductase QueH [Bacillota bacterium]
MGLRILLHCCCAPCSAGPVPALRGEGYDVVGFFWNPNIHPYTEYLRRREAMKDYSSQVGLDVIYGETYDLEEFLTSVIGDLDDRCRQCYRLRLGRAAREARAGGFDGFSSTLLVSPYQKHGVMVEEAEAWARALDTRFIYRDFRPLYRESTLKSRGMGLYRQEYCGCVFSEAERYGRSKG